MASGPLNIILRPFVADRTARHIWLFSIKNEKLNIQIPSLGYEFRKVSVRGDRISATLKEDPDDEYSKFIAKLDIEIVEGLLDGKLNRKEGVPDHTVTGRYEKLYKKAQKAEKIFRDRFEDEKRRLIASKSEELELKVKGQEKRLPIFERREIGKQWEKENKGNA